MDGFSGDERARRQCWGFCSMVRGVCIFKKHSLLWRVQFQRVHWEVHAWVWSFLNNSSLPCVCMSVPWLVCGGRNTTHRSCLLFCVGPEYQTQMVRLGGRCSYLLNWQFLHSYFHKKLKNWMDGLRRSSLVENVTNTCKALGSSLSTGWKDKNGLGVLKRLSSG